MAKTKLIKKIYLEFEDGSTKETIFLDSSSSSIETVEYNPDRAAINEVDDANFADFRAVDKAFKDVGFMLLNSGWRSDGRTSKIPLDIMVSDHPELSQLGLAI